MSWRAWALLVAGLAAALFWLLWVLLIAPAAGPTDTHLRPVAPHPAITWEPPVTPTGSAPIGPAPIPPPEPRR